MATIEHIDSIIVQHLHLFKKPGVISVRPGFKARGGWLTREPAIVVCVKRKKQSVPAADLLPASVQDIPVDVRQASPIEILRATDPHAYAAKMADMPEGNEPADKQAPTFPLERDPEGHLIAPVVDAAMSAARKKTVKPAAGTTYQKLPAATLAEVQGNFAVTCFASPDAGWPTVQPFLNGVTQTLTVAMYEFTAPYIVSTVSQVLKGKKLNLVLDDPSYDDEKRDQTDDQTQQQLATALGNALNFAWAAEKSDPHSTQPIFPSAYHIKVAVRDGAAVWVSSGNFNRSNLPDIAPLTNPGDAATAATTDRDWHVIIANPTLAGVFESVILRDLAQAQPHQGPTKPKAGTKVPSPQGKPIPSFFAPKTFSGAMAIQPVLTPDNYVDVILPLILGAKQSFWMQTQYINPSKTFPEDVKKPLASRSVLERLIAAVATIQKQGVDVRLLLGTTTSTSALEQLQMYGGIDVSAVRLQDNVHNKGMLIDASIAVIGSQNWSTEGVDTNRDASVVIKNPAIAAYWAQVFLLDWNDRSVPQETPAK